ncbi:phasin family protein [Methylobacterium sp. E-046]|uniref:phasin family protein n=1 Tax=Methylobacterium sp. E-046 TaxID=2836576 RepID=UPI001FBA0B75|nr:phasin family protein [Methylobacterium sp. E-046]MCJ2097697.1 phasin family protein [Methylobacterium sp. E-046]
MQQYSKLLSHRSLIGVLVLSIAVNILINVVRILKISNGQNTDHGKQNGQDARNAEAVKANFDSSAKQGKQFTDATRDGMTKMAELRENATETTKQVMQQSIESAVHQARESSDRFSKTLGFSDGNSENLARQSKQNIEAISRCGTVLGQAFYDASRRLFDLGQKQYQRNLEGMTKLAQAKSVQEFTTIQGELMRQGLEHMVQDSKVITETSARAVEEASKSLSAVTQAR